MDLWTTRYANMASCAARMPRFLWDLVCRWCQGLTWQESLLTWETACRSLKRATKYTACRSIRRHSVGKAEDNLLTVAEDNLLALKPSNLSFEEALLAFDTVDFKKQSVFIVGGAGCVGSLAIQQAKHVFEASRIVSTSSTGKLEFVKSLGADLVVDYTKQSYEQVDEKFDFVFDTIGESFKSHVVAKEGGKIVDIATFPAHPRAVNIVLQSQGSNLERLSKFIESGKLKPVIDPKSPYAFSDVVEAFKHQESGRARGKIVISPI